MPDVLLVGEDDGLLHSRSAVLGWGGFSTAECVVADLANHGSDTRYAVAVLCHSIRRTAREEVSHNIRSRWPGIKLVQMDKIVLFASDDGTHADVTVTAGDPGRLLSAVRHVLTT